jgi:AraC-like DNA-binding protein
MRSLARPPRCPLLVGRVDSFWVSARCDVGGDEIVLPSGRAQLVVDGDRSSALVVGPRTVPAIVRPSAFAAGVSLSGVGLSALSNVPVWDLVDTVVAANTIWEGERWGPCLDTSDPVEILDRLEQETLRHLRGEAEQNQMVAIAERAIRAGVGLDALAPAIGADRRRLVPAFREAVGLGPKQYQRILRFQRSLRAMRLPRPDPLVAIASSCGYADQAHMSREFKEFSGLTPACVHGASSTAFNHVPAAARPCR